MPSNHSRATSSPSITLRAVTNAWNEPLVGAQPILPLHSGSVKPRMEPGRSSSLKVSVLYATTRARPETPTHCVLRQLTQNPFVGQGPQGARVLGEEDVGRAVLAFFEDGRG